MKQTMKNLFILFFAGYFCLALNTLSAQERVPYNFEFLADISKEEIIEDATIVEYSDAQSLRLFFKDVDLGEKSYLILEGPDGVKQELNATTIAYWNNSSAYFNGSRVKVSIYVAPGETPSFTIFSLQVNKISTTIRKNDKVVALTKRGSGGSRSGSPRNGQNIPYAKAIGRFTNGTDSHGTGWITPNGSIVTSWKIYHQKIKFGYDIIEFNVPDSDTNGSINHPPPQDQYPLKTGVSQVSLGSKNINFKGPAGTRLTGWAVLEALPNSTGLRPGERQQSYLLLGLNSTSKRIEDADQIIMHLLHYGDWPGDFSTGKFKTLHDNYVGLKEQKEELRIFNTDGDRDSYILYSMPQFNGSDSGGPIIHSKRVAVGVHNQYVNGIPSYGVGFREHTFKSHVQNFFTPHVTYVDGSALTNANVGNIISPIRKVQMGIEKAAPDDVVYIAKGDYPESVYANKPLILKAAVGLVRIGTGQTRMLEEPQFPIDDEYSAPEPLNLDRQEIEVYKNVGLNAAPNPFRNQVDINYSIEEEQLVNIKVIDLFGKELVTLVDSQQGPGAHTVRWNGNSVQGAPVPAGIYMVRIQHGKQLNTLKIVKR